MYIEMELRENGCSLIHPATVRRQHFAWELQFTVEVLTSKQTNRGCTLTAIAIILYQIYVELYA